LRIKISGPRGTGFAPSPKDMTLWRVYPKPKHEIQVDYMFQLNGCPDFRLTEKPLTLP
jgi:hypothetical protein